MSEVPIKSAHIWQVFNWRDGRWEPVETIQTWTKNHALACDKARMGTPAYNRGTKFKVSHLRTDAVPDGMILVEKNPGGVSWKVPDTYGEMRALARENARAV